MMATAAGEEVSFVAGMEREEDCREITVTLDSAGKKAWRLDGMLHRVVDVAGHALDKVRSLADRGPPDYAPESEFERGMKAGATLGNRYTNGDGDERRSGNGEKALLKWILGVLGLLLVGGSGGVVAMYGQLAAIQKGQEGHEQRISRLEAERDRRAAQNGAP